MNIRDVQLVIAANLPQLAGSCYRYLVPLVPAGCGDFDKTDMLRLTDLSRILVTVMSPANLQ